MVTLLVLLVSPVMAADLAASFSALRAQTSAAVYSWDQEETLLELLRDRDPAVRREAVRALKAFVAQRSSTRERVIGVLQDSGEEVSVRREAAKSLSVMAGDDRVQRVLLDAAEREASPDLRQISYKSLYWAAGQGSRPRDALLDAARRESDAVVRRGAIWALFAASSDERVQDALMDIARRDGDVAVRDEALRSLYYGMGDPDVRRLAVDLAKDAGGPRAVRVSATLLNSFRVESSQGELLEALAARDSDPEVRRAAVLALSGDGAAEIQRRFHLIRRGRNGVVIGDPLDDE